MNLAQLYDESGLAEALKTRPAVPRSRKTHLSPTDTGGPQTFVQSNGTNRGSSVLSWSEKGGGLMGIQGLNETNVVGSLGVHQFTPHGKDEKDMEGRDSWEYNDDADEMRPTRHGKAEVVPENANRYMQQWPGQRYYAGAQMGGNGTN